MASASSSSLFQLFLEMVGLGGQAADLAKIRQVNAGTDQPAGVHQDTEAQHRQRTPRVPDEFADLVADPLAQPEPPKGSGTTIVKSVKGTIKKCWASVVVIVVGKSILPIR